MTEKEWQKVHGFTDDELDLIKSMVNARFIRKHHNKPDEVILTKGHIISIKDIKSNGKNN